MSGMLFFRQLKIRMTYRYDDFSDGWPSRPENG